MACWGLVELASLCGRGHLNPVGFPTGTNRNSRLVILPPMSQALGIGFKENISFPKSEALASATQKFSSLVFFSLELRQQGVIAVSMNKNLLHQ